MNEEKKEVKMIALDFTHVAVEQNIGEWTDKDLSKVVGNAIHKQAGDIGLDDVARKIYYEGKAEVNEGMARIIKAIIEGSNFALYACQAILKTIDEAVNKENV